MINGQAVGNTPVLYCVPSSEVSRVDSFHYRLERKGYQTEEGALELLAPTGRLVGVVATLGVYRLFRPISTFQDTYQFDLLAEPGAAAAHMHRLQDLLQRGQITQDEYEQLLRGFIDAPQARPLIDGENGGVK